MESARQAATMIANTGVVLFAGTAVAFFLNPEKTPLVIAVFGVVFWVTCFFFSAMLTKEV